MNNCGKTRGHGCGVLLNLHHLWWMSQIRKRGMRLWWLRELEFSPEKIWGHLLFFGWMLTLHRMQIVDSNWKLIYLVRITKVPCLALSFLGADIEIQLDWIIFLIRLIVSQNCLHRPCQSVNVETNSGSDDFLAALLTFLCAKHENTSSRSALCLISNWNWAIWVLVFPRFVFVSFVVISR